jgi:hypothetical protein
MAFSLTERARIRYHFGYPITGMGASLAAGIPFDTQFMFLLDRAMNMVLPEAEETVRMLISRLDQTDEAIFQCQIRMQASKVDGIELRANEADALEDEYYRQASRLADCLHCPLYQFSARFQGRGPLKSGVQTGMVARVS